MEKSKDKVDLKNTANDLEVLHAPLILSKTFQRTHRACSSVVLAGFALPECPGSSSRVYPALEDLTAVVYCGLVPSSLPGSIFYVHVCHPRGALHAPGLAGCLVGRRE
jgi:hypothetical protein